MRSCRGAPPEATLLSVEADKPRFNTWANGHSGGPRTHKQGQQIEITVCVIALAATAYAGLAYGGGLNNGWEGGAGGQWDGDHHGHPRYKFDYAVHDSHTGDIKNQWEVRDGDVVKGEYSLHEPDGTIRTVSYTADKHSGFNAHVKRSGHAVHPQGLEGGAWGQGLGGGWGGLGL